MVLSLWYVMGMGKAWSDVGMVLRRMKRIVRCMLIWLGVEGSD